LRQIEKKALNAGKLVKIKLMNHIGSKKINMFTDYIKQLVAPDLVTTTPLKIDGKYI
jgi:hypothetical protein